jgi:hypothetical protein
VDLVDGCRAECPNKPDLLQFTAVLEQVREWAYWNREVSKPRKAFGHGGSRRPRKDKKPDPLDTWLHYLGAIYKHVFEKELRFSTHWQTGEAGGPFGRYLHACLRPILLKNTPSVDALRSRWRGRHP